MKIKKLSLLFSGIISVGAITPVVYAYSTSKNTKHEMSVKSKILTYIERKTKVDYAYAEKALSNMKISDLLKVTSKEDFDSELTQKIIELQNEYLDLFKSRNYSLEEIQTYMCETFPEYKKEYEKIINDQKVGHGLYSLTKNTNISISPEQVKTLREQADKLSVQRGIMIAQCTIFSATTAAMYAISWCTFGLSIPVAIACTTAATQTGILQNKILNSINIINDLINSSSVESNKITEYFDPKEELLKEIDGIITMLSIIGGVAAAVLAVSPAFPPAYASVVPACSALTFASGVTLTIMTFIKLVISKM